MTDYPLDFDPTFTGSSLSPTVAGWFEDNNPATVATFHTGGSAFDNRLFGNFHGDLTAVTGLIGWRVEVDVISGSGQLYWEYAFDDVTSSKFFAFQGYITIDGAGTYVSYATTPYFIGTGDAYTGIYDVVARIANEAGYPHAYGKIEPTFGSGGDIVVSEYRVIFYTEDALSVVRQWPRDDSLGANSVTRVYPPPRAHRVIGGQP